VRLNLAFNDFCGSRSLLYLGRHCINDHDVVGFSRRGDSRSRRLESGMRLDVGNGLTTTEMRVPVGQPNSYSEWLQPAAGNRRRLVLGNLIRAEVHLRWRLRDVRIGFRHAPLPVSFPNTPVMGTGPHGWMRDHRSRCRPLFLRNRVFKTESKMGQSHHAPGYGPAHGCQEGTPDLKSWRNRQGDRGRVRLSGSKLSY